MSEWQTRKLFRSLEMGYQATAMPFENHSTIYDFGSRAALWVSAFEILSHPGGKGKADLSTVLDLLGGYDWANKIVRRKSYSIKYAGKNFRLNLVQKLYKELYDTRNVFLHGSPVRGERLHPFKNTRVPMITRFAPLAYKVALTCFLERFKDRRTRTNWRKEYVSKLLNEQKISEALLKAKG